MLINFAACIYDKLLENFDRAVLVWPGQSYTGWEVLNRIGHIRHELTLRQVRPGEQVLLALPVSFDLICGLLAVMALGAIPVLPPAGTSPPALLALLRREGIRVVLLPKRLRFPLAWLIRGLGIRLVTPPVSGKIETNPDPKVVPPLPVPPDQPALISHSSGSTGRPKAIRRSHRVLRAQHQALSAAFPPWPGQRDFPLFPNILLHNLAVGAVSILPDLPRFRLSELDPARIIRQLLEQRVQTLTGNVFYFRKLVAHLSQSPQTFPHVRALGIGGSPVPEGLIESLKLHFTGAAVYVIYGSSEAEPIAIRRADEQTPSPRLGYVVGPIHPAIQVEIRPLGTLVLPDGRTYPAGEIAVRGDHVVTTGDWLPTGDFGYVDEASQLVLTGRKGNEQIHQGVQHYQIEHVLSAVAGVDRVAARAAATGFIVYVQGTADEAALRRLLDEQFPARICTRLVFRELPVDARHLSKIRYDQLPTDAL